MTSIAKKAGYLHLTTVIVVGLYLCHHTQAFGTNFTSSRVQRSAVRGHE